MRKTVSAEHAKLQVQINYELIEIEVAEFYETHPFLNPCTKILCSSRTIVPVQAAVEYSMLSRGSTIDLYRMIAIGRRVMRSMSQWSKGGLEVSRSPVAPPFIEMETLQRPSEVGEQMLFICRKPAPKPKSLNKIRGS